jgi:hypothetical protein
MLDYLTLKLGIHRSSKYTFDIIVLDFLNDKC